MLDSICIDESQCHMVDASCIILVDDGRFRSQLNLVLFGQCFLHRPQSYRFS